MAALIRAERILNKQRIEDGLEPTTIFELINENLVGVRAMDVSVQFVVIMLWAALSSEDDALSINDVSKLIESPLAATAKVFQAVQAIFPADKVEEPAVDPMNAPAGSGF
ncbi:MAG: hypothetical protein ACREO5_01795 [Candidatus Binatia bacterium]